MREYLFYTDEGYTEGPREGYPVENCQVLGRMRGADAEDARRLLLRENRWIEEAGFSEERICCEEIVANGE